MVRSGIFLNGWRPMCAQKIPANWQTIKEVAELLKSFSQRVEKRDHENGNDTPRKSSTNDTNDN
jgi:hypothetical protein